MRFLLPGDVGRGILKGTTCERAKETLREFEEEARQLRNLQPTREVSDRGADDSERQKPV